MNAREIYKECYRLMRDTTLLPLVNHLWLNHRQVYRAASESYIAEASDFSGWLNRDRKYQFFRRKHDLFERRFTANEIM